MNDFFTVEMDGTNGEPIRVTFRKSSVDCIQRIGRTVNVLIRGQTPIAFNLPDFEKAKTLYLQIGTEMEKL